MNQDISISRLLIENLPIAFAYHQIILDRQGKPVDYIFIDINPAFETVIRLKKDQVIGKKVTELLPVINRSGFDWIAAFGQVAGSGNSACFKKYFEPLGGWYEIVACSDRPGYFAMLLRDITRKKKVQKRLRENEALFRLLVEHMGCGLVVEDCQRNIVLANQAFCEMFSIPGSPEELQGKNSSFLVEKAKLLFTDPHHFALCLEELIAGRQAIFDQEVRFVDGRIFCQDYTPVLEEDSSIMGHMWQYWDITGRKQIEDQLRYLSLHDQLTGLYNRAYFENELHRLSKSREFPVSILSVDLDGLKLINDASGHLPGDSYLKAVAEILRRSLRASDILSRVGGDEFAALLPSTGYNSGEEIVKRIQSRVDQYNRNHQDQLPLSISIGLATAENKEQSLKKTFKEADEHMYRIKLYRGVDARAQMIKTLLTTLGERDMITEGHARRLEKLCLTIGRKIKLSSKQLSDLVLLAQVHDLGKVGVPDHILFKTGPLNEKELEVMRLHSEKGYRIALSSTGLSGIADLILMHHEHWDGSGYPLGIKGEEIPVNCRILAIVDAYDAMTTDRPYRKAISKQAAMAELERCSGSQFDPHLVEVFLSVLRESDEDEDS